MHNGPMGLREKKAVRNRERIVSEGMALFGAKGYEETTMEMIAEAADLSPSTLYRNFPSKDLIVLASFLGNTAKMADAFTEAVQTMPLAHALAEAIFAVLEIEDVDPQKALLVRSILDQSPVARAKLWDYLREQQLLLAAQIASCSKLKANDPRAILASRISILVLQTAADIWRASNKKTSSRAIAENVMKLLGSGAVVIPEAPPDSVTPGNKPGPRKH